jgi:hypothetical protein
MCIHFGVFCIWIGTQGLVLSRQGLCHVAIPEAFFSLVIFQLGSCALFPGAGSRPWSSYLSLTLS